MVQKIVVALAFLVLTTSSAWALSEQDQHEIQVWDRLTAEGTAVGELPEMDLENGEEELVEHDLGIGAYILKASLKCKTLHVTVLETASPQTLSATCDGKLVFGPVLTSTGKGGSTPSGTYKVYNRVKHASSAAYNNAPMPRFLVFKSCGKNRPNCIGIHGTIQKNYKYLGSRASKGCVRLTFENAVTLWNLSHASGVTMVTVKK